MKNKKLFLMLIISITVIVMFNSSLVFADGLTDKTRSKVDFQIEKLVKIIGYIIILVMAIKEILQEMQNGDMKAIWTALVKYLIIYAILLGLPVMLKWIEVIVEDLKASV